MTKENSLLLTNQKPKSYSRMENAWRFLCTAPGGRKLCVRTTFTQLRATEFGGCGVQWLKLQAGHLAQVGSSTTLLKILVPRLWGI